MAHELDEIIGGKHDGKKAMFAVGGSVWHDPENSVAIGAAPTMREALEIGGLDFEIDLRPMTTTVEIREGETIEVPIPEAIGRAVVRTDRTGALGIVGPSYHAIQNRIAFAPLEPLIDAGLLKLETGGSLKGGADVWMLGAWDFSGVPSLADTLSAGGLDPVKPYALISNNHTGKRKAIVQETPIRVVCANTLGFALGRINYGRESARVEKLDKAIAIRHTKNGGSRLVAAAEEMFSSVLARYTIIAEQYAAMRAVRLSEEQFAEMILDVLAPLPVAKTNTGSKGRIAEAHHERATARATAKRDRLSHLWANGKGHTGDASAWEAYNGAIESLDHDADLWKVKGESRIESIFEGSLGKHKEALAESVIPYAVAEYVRVR